MEVPKVPAGNVEIDTKCRWGGDSRPNLVVGVHEMKEKRKDIGLRLDLRFVDQHDRKAVANRIHAVTLLALQTLGILAVLEIGFTRGADQHFEQIFRKHDSGIIRSSAAHGQRSGNRG